MFDTLWAAVPGQRCIAAIKGKKKLHFWFDNNEDAQKKAVELDQDGFNVYFSPSLYDPDSVAKKQTEINPKTHRHFTGRDQTAVSAIPALWLDLDAGEGKDYDSLESALAALNKWVQDNNIPKPTHLVCSGYGLHVYWRLSRLVSHREWLPVAKHLKQACRVGGLAIDPARTADSASLMRVPGTHNRKQRTLAPVKVLGSSDESVDLHAFRAALPMMGPTGSVGSTAVSDEWNTQAKLPPGDAHKIADKCQQMGQIRFHKGKVSEPVWRAGLSVLWRCEDAENLIHAWSVGDERYDADETQSKAEATAGPATCQHFAELNPEGCAGCPFAGNVTSPINLAYAEELPDVISEDDFTRLPGYTVNKSGVYIQPLSDEGGPLTKIADFPIWIEESREVVNPNDPTLSASLLLAWKDIRGVYRQVPISQAKLHDDRQWTTWLADNNLISFVKVTPMRNYISQMHKARFRDKGARTVYSCLGWYDNHNLFVLGRKGVTKDGVVDVAVNIKAKIAELEPTGTLEAWRNATKHFDRPELRPQAFGLLLGFASPLLDLVGKHGGVVVFTGRSGFGKSLSAQAGLSIYSHPEKIFETAESSHGGIGLHMSEHRHIPVLVDEITHMSAQRLRDLIYMAANGAQRTTLTQSRERRNMPTWRLVTMLTSNHSILDRKLSEIEEAHRRRVIEVPVLDRISKTEAAEIFNAITTNYGVAAPPYLQLVMKHKDKIPQLFDLMESTVVGWGYGDPADRFAIWTCAAALLGGLLAYIAGALAFNPVPVVKAIAQQSAEAAADIPEPGDHAKEALLEMLVSESRRICHWTAGKLATTDVFDPVARVSNGVLYVKSSELREVWQKEHIFLPSIRNWVESVGTWGVKKYRLAPGTPPVSCYLFSMEKLGWDVDTLHGDDR